jgi:2-amino-4-hydroxy-6-hydroxymethyldihydropteridine diphosphokinase
MPPTRNLNTVLLAFGSNKGDRKKFITDALARLETFGTVEKISPLFITKPEGFLEQPDFINGAALFKTALTPQELLKTLKKTEAETGRTPTFKNGPREIDLDIIFYNDIVLEEDDLTVPHPRLAEREFVLLPLSFIAPHYKHPVTGETVSRLLKKFLKQRYPAPVKHQREMRQKGKRALRLFKKIFMTGLV